MTSDDHKKDTHSILIISNTVTLADWDCWILAYLNATFILEQALFRCNYEAIYLKLYLTINSSAVFSNYNPTSCP